MPRLARVADGLAKIPPSLAVGISVAALLVIGVLDHETGHAVRFPILYALVVLFAGWTGGLGHALFIAVVAGGVDLFADHVLGAAGEVDASEVVNEVLRVPMWILLGAFGAALRSRIDAVERERRRAAEAYRRLRDDVRAAERVQQAFLNQEVPDDPRVEIACRHLPARGLSGDFFSLDLEGDRLSLCVADVSGKGPPAALGTALLRGALDEARNRATDPADLLAVVHRRILPYLPDMMFVTCFYAELDLGTGTLSWASAGHEPAFLRRGSGDLASLEASGLPLGVDEVQLYEEHRESLSPGDSLLVYTDGLPQARPMGSRAPLGEEPICAVMAATVAPDDQVARLERLVEGPGSAVRNDDVVMVALRWKG